jgi:hypothetical protein
MMGSSAVRQNICVQRRKLGIDANYCLIVRAPLRAFVPAVCHVSAYWILPYAEHSTRQYVGQHMTLCLDTRPTLSLYDTQVGTCCVHGKSNCMTYMYTYICVGEEDYSQHLTFQHLKVIATYLPLQYCPTIKSRSMQNDVDG